MTFSVADQMQVLARSSRRSAGMSFVGLVIVLGSLVFAAWCLHAVERTVRDKTEQVRELDTQRLSLEKRAKELSEELTSLGVEKSNVIREAQSLDRAVSTLLFATLDSKAIAKIAPKVDWLDVSSQVKNMKPGQRKTAVLLALFAAWRKVPQKNGGSSLETGMDSPRFLDFVLKKAGVPTPAFSAREPASVALMRQFHVRKDQPAPGDLMFFATGPGCPGVGNPACMYLAPGEGEGHGVCVGVPFYSDILQVLDSESFPRACAFLGYFDVPYDGPPA